MNYETWAQDAKKKLSKLPDNELRTIATGNDVDGREIANKILLDRKNKAIVPNRGVAAVDEDWSI